MKILTILGCLMALPSAIAQQITIDSITHDGSLTFSGANVGTTATVEWAASLTDTGRTNWHRLAEVAVTNETMMTDVPMFFRVRGIPVPFLRDGLVAYYPFNGNANDESGNGNHGTASGPSLTTDRFGNPTSAYYFPPNQDYACISCGSRSSLDLTNEFTLSLWYNAASWTHVGSPALLSRNNDTDRSWRLYYRAAPERPGESTGFTFDSTGPSGPDILQPNGQSEPLNVWRMLTITRNAAEIRMYINGISAPVGYADNTPLLSFSGTLRIGIIGGNYASRTSRFVGKMDDIRIYSRALTSNEVQSLYAYDGPSSDITPPANVSSFDAVGGDGWVSLSWGSPPDGDYAGVKILRKSGGYSSSISDGTLIFNGTGTSTTDTGLVNGSTYFYTAFSYDGAMNYSSGAMDAATPSSTADTTPPSNVSGFTAIAGDGQVSLSWNNPSDSDFQGVRVQRRTGGYPSGVTDGFTIYEGSETATTDDGLSNGIPYYYAAFSYDEIPNYASGVTATATPSSSADTTPPSDVSSFAATAGDGQVSLSWSNPSDDDFAGVRVLRKTGGYPSSSSDGTVVYNGTGTSTADTGLANGTPYYYKAFSYDEVPNYASGATATATPNVADPPTPTSHTLLHSFPSIAGDGKTPNGSLTLSGSMLYGMTEVGGAAGYGTIFRMNVDGSGYTVLHSFTASTTDGSHPDGSLTIAGSTLYGMTEVGGASGDGIVFKMNTDGTGFSILHHFNYNDRGDGAMPTGSLTLSGSTLYGMTDDGGANYYGAIFKINTDGTGFALLHSFDGRTDGATPADSLIIDGSTLYGMTQSAIVGQGYVGTVFKINTDGSGFANLHFFSGGSTDGSMPKGYLTLVGSALYGMTLNGGANDTGTIFTLNKDGSGFGLLHSFAASSWSVNDGKSPWGSLTANGSTLYGMTVGGGADAQGAVFRINCDGTAFQLLYYFHSGTSIVDGRSPYGAPLFLGRTLYGMTTQGGANGYGTVFSLSE